MTPRTTTRAQGPHTIDTIRALLDRSAYAVEEAILRIYDLQTADEQASGTTTHDNGVGFSGCDAEILTSFAHWIKRSRYAHGARLTERQLVIARKKIKKYAAQLARIANAKHVASTRDVVPSVATTPCPECGGTRRVETNIMNDYAEVPCPRCGDAEVLV